MKLKRFWMKAVGYRSVNLFTTALVWTEILCINRFRDVTQWLISLTCLFSTPVFHTAFPRGGSIQGGPKRMQHFWSLISKKSGTKIKLVCALMSRTFFFQQNDTKINDFDEGILIPEPFFWGNVVFKICSFCIESHVRSREEFLWVAPPTPGL